MRSLSLGSQDAYTGWYAKNWTEDTIHMTILPKGSITNILGIGYYARHEYDGFTDSAVVEGDEVLDGVGRYFEVKAVKPWYKLDEFVLNECELAYMPLHADRPATSGTWISVYDARYNTKLYLDTYLTAANMKEDNNSTNATYITAMGLPDYPIQKVFLGSKNVDLIFSIEKPNTSAVVGHDKYVEGYVERVPIKVYAVDKSGITAVRVTWSAEHELRRVVETYPLGSMRTLDAVRENTVSLGSTTLYSSEYVLTYERDKT